MTAQEIKDRLAKGNLAYIEGRSLGNTGEGRRRELVEGQHPWAVVVTCSDSRVVPEAIFGCGLGELFVIRVAGNVLTPTQVASVLYAVEHLHVGYVLVLGHTGCGAIAAALSEENGPILNALLGPIRLAIGKERDPYLATLRNVAYGVRHLSRALDGLDVVVEGGVYDLATGKVVSLND